MCEAARSELQRGEFLFSEGKVDEAKQCFLRIMEKNPRNQDACNNLGVIAYAAGHLAEAEEYFLRALEADAFHRGTLLNIAKLRRALGRSAEAADLLEGAIERGVEDPGLLNQLATLYLDLDEMEKTREILEKSLALDDGQVMVRQALQRIMDSEPSAKAEREEPGKGEKRGPKNGDGIAYASSDRASRSCHVVDRPVRVLFAPVEIAHNSGNLIEPLRDYNIQADVINLSNGGAIQRNNTTVTQRVIEELHKNPIRTIVKLARTYDLIYFQFGCTFLDREYMGGAKATIPYPDLSYIRNEGAKIASAYWGSDIWDPSMFIYTRLKALGHHQLEKAPYSSRYKMHKIEVMGHYSEFVLCADEVRRHFPKLVNGETPINLAHWPYGEKRFDHTPLRVAHMPSNRYKKNSDIILSVFATLKGKGIVEPVLIENVSHEKIPEVLGECDLFVDQMTRMFGKSAVEAMALGIPVLIRRDGPIDGQRGKAPVFLVSDNRDLERTISKLAHNRDLLRTAALRGREYVENYHDSRKVAAELADHLTRAVKGKSISHFITSTEDRYSIFNTRYYDQALPLLMESGDYERALTTCVSGIHNQVSLDTCYRHFDELMKRGLVGLGTARPHCDEEKTKLAKRMWADSEAQRLG